VIGKQTDKSLRLTTYPQHRSFLQTRQLLIREGAETIAKQNK